MSFPSLTPSTGAIRCYKASSKNSYSALYAIQEKPSAQKRGFRQHAHLKHCNKTDSERRRIDAYQRLCQSRNRRKAAHHHPRTHVLDHNHHPWWNWGYGWSRTNQKFPEHQHGRDPRKEFWETGKTSMQKRIEQIKKQVDADPYAALFGRRLEPFSLFDKHDNIWSSFCRSFLGSERETKAKPKDTVADVKATNVSPSSKDYDAQLKKPTPVQKPIEASSKGTIANTDLEFDPISGRMIPKSKHLDVTDRKAQDEKDSKLESNDVKDKQPTSPESPSQQMAHNRLVNESIGAIGGGQMASELPKRVQTPPVIEENTKDEQFPATTTKSAKNALLGSKQQSDLRMKQEKTEDLDLLSASDIRASYDSKTLDHGSDVQKQQKRKELEDVFKSADPAGYIDAQSIRAKFQCHHGLEPPSEKVIDIEPLNISSTNQSQSQPLESPETSSLNKNMEFPLDRASSPAIYRVLAYDPSTLQVSKAETSSSHTTDEIFHPAEILPRLNNPAKFLPYFAEMQNDGYEIVSGGGDILVFRRDRKDNVVLNDEIKSPTTDPSSPEVKANGDARTESGTPNNESGIRKTVRRMFLTGVMTAATCYAIGVVVEYFRTGGKDGRGIDGFTEFESERRRREEEA
ncbi:hypothetical protein ASPWEDRAFT_613920 [Aspergillus wentii DTO 134E9]|uniref:Uncharacterized protein n=1 Tax=Aspergillus wentii DTO 134E9 TaxID=1073089 RepID=A0A1L9RE98_ASPWE|nr:uncharacterized protein ASPWEDRAFT_613920 [Aspergillus wentii DTO 134E9]OJJ33197.1 hypothetical protein ASPWEDRAFT_613920 [Aspergillus wentii DTO 134E9]